MRMALYMIITTRHMMESAETAEKRYESKKQKEENRIRNYGWSIFGEVGCKIDRVYVLGIFDSGI